MKNILSENINISLDSRKTGINNNVFFCGSSNNRTSFLESNILQMNGSYIVSDYKGILYKDTQSVMRKNGYDVKFLDFKDFNKQSNHYNPFMYFNSDNDIFLYVEQLFDGIPQTSIDYINYDYAERAFARFLFMYVFHIGVEDDNGVLQHNMYAVLRLLFEGIHNLADEGYSIDSKLDERMKELEKKEPKHNLVKIYNKIIRSCSNSCSNEIIMSILDRLILFGRSDMGKLVLEDDLDITSTCTKKTIIYVIYDEALFDFFDSKNEKVILFINQFFLQIVRYLFDVIDSVHGGKSPINITFMIDLDILPLAKSIIYPLAVTMSRNINMFLCVKSLAEFEGDFDMLNELCDSFVYTDVHDSITSEKIKLIISKYKKILYRIYRSYITKFSGININKEVTLLSKLPCIKKDECIVVINRVGAFKDELYKLRGIENETTGS